jgi:hypothetical protein
LPSFRRLTETCETHCFAEGPLDAPSGIEKELARLYSLSDPEVVKPQER